MDTTLKLPGILPRGKSTKEKNFTGLDDTKLRQITQFEARNLDIAARFTKQLEAAREFENFFFEQKKLKEINRLLVENENQEKEMLIKKNEDNAHISIQKNLDDHFSPSNLALLHKSRQMLHQDYSDQV
jgi:hypothetical protein